MRFKYKVKDKDGVIKEGIIVAEFMEDVLLNLQKSGFTEIKLAPVEENDKKEEKMDTQKERDENKETENVDKKSEPSQDKKSSTKKCPYCTEEIQDDAIKCRYCGEMLGTTRKYNWCFKTNTLIIAFLCIGPFALPLLWFNSRFRRKTKIIVSIVVIILSYYLGILFVNSWKSISSYYQTIFKKF